jgi:hypothetical protein
MENDTLCKNCNSPLGWHIIPKNNCPGSRDGTYQGGMFFEPITTPTPPTEHQETLDEIIQKILLQLDTINGQIETINSTLKNLQ